MALLPSPGLMVLLATSPASTCPRPWFDIDILGFGNVMEPLPASPGEHETIRASEIILSGRRCFKMRWIHAQRHTTEVIHMDSAIQDLDTDTLHIEGPMGFECSVDRSGQSSVALTCLRWESRAIPDPAAVAVDVVSREVIDQQPFHSYNHTGVQ